MPGLAPAGEVLSCCAARKYPKKRAPLPRLADASFPRCGRHGRAASQTRLRLEQRSRKPRPFLPSLGVAEGKVSALPYYFARQA